MIRTLMAAATAAALFATPGLAAGDAAAGEKTFAKCKACHVIQNGDTVVQKGGKVGPNLYGVIGRPAGSVEGFKYGETIVAAGAKGLVWDEAQLAEYVKDPKAFLAAYTGDAAAKSKMAFKLPAGGEDVAAYLASVAVTN